LLVVIARSGSHTRDEPYPTPQMRATLRPDEMALGAEHLAQREDLRLFCSTIRSGQTRLIGWSFPRAVPRAPMSATSVSKARPPRSEGAAIG
jgi:hypothetical protein